VIPVSAVTTGHDAISKNGFAKPAALMPPTPAPAPKPTVGFHGAVSEFKRRLIEATLAQSGGNRTRTAKALGLQRTYLLRLMREFEIHAPLSQRPPRRSDMPSTTPPPPTGWR
jgi:DNA-binding NtrC family response regulator